MGLQISENLSSISQFLVTIPQARQTPNDFSVCGANGEYART
jgi:hypothetical protein